MCSGTDARVGSAAPAVTKYSVFMAHSSAVDGTTDDDNSEAELPKGGVGAAAEQGDRCPAVTGDDGAVGPEAVAERGEQLGARRRLEAPRQAVALTNAEVVDGPHVEAAELEHQVHLRRPTADAAHGYERCNELVVAEPRRPIQVDGAVEDLGRQVAQRRELVRGQPGRPQRFVGYCSQRLGRQRVADRRTHPPVDRLGSAPGELLVDDRP